MKNISLADDYLKRSEARLKALDTLFTEESWPDVVREAQELVELAVKGLLRKWNIEVPRVHDVSGILDDQKESLTSDLKTKIDFISKVSRELRRDRELAFYGSEDLTPLEFYKRQDAEHARSEARKVVAEIKLLWTHHS